MPKRYRLLHLAVGGCLALFGWALAQEHQRAEASEAAHAQEAKQDPLAAAIARAVEQDNKTDWSRPKCTKPESHDEADLCQQIRMAKAAEDVLWINKLQLFFGGIGILFVVINLMYARRAAEAAGVAATAAIQAAQAAGDQASDMKRSIEASEKMAAAAAEQAASMRRSIEATERTAEAAARSAAAVPHMERAYLFLNLDTKTNFRNIPEDAVNVKRGIQITLKNHGRTPAIIKTIWAEAGCFALDDEPTKEPSWIGNSPGGWALSAGETTPTIPIEYDITPEQIRDWKEEKIKILMWGKVIYSDVFQNEHATLFCYRYSHSDGGFRVHGSKKVNSHT